MDDFVIRAALAGVGLSLATGPLGSFVVWRRMVYFGDAVAHAAILGVVISLAFSISVLAGTMFVALGVGVLATVLGGKGRGTDTVLGVLAHSSLAVGLVAVSFLDGVRIDMSAFLFGDILTVSTGDLAAIWGGSALVLGVVLWRWPIMLMATLSEDLAASSGINPRRERLILTLILALVVALSLKIVGALLIGAMLIIPPAAARSVSDSPEKMVVVAVLIGAMASLGGIGLSMMADTPAGPSIVVTAGVIFVISLFARLRAD